MQVWCARIFETHNPTYGLGVSDTSLAGTGVPWRWTGSARSQEWAKQGKENHSTALRGGPSQQTGPGIPPTRGLCSICPTALRQGRTTHWDGVCGTQVHGSGKVWPGSRAPDTGGDGTREGAGAKGCGIPCLISSKVSASTTSSLCSTVPCGGQRGWVCGLGLPWVQGGLGPGAAFLKKMRPLSSDQSGDCEPPKGLIACRRL